MRNYFLFALVLLGNILFMNETRCQKNIQCPDDTIRICYDILSFNLNQVITPVGGTFLLNGVPLDGTIYAPRDYPNISNEMTYILGADSCKFIIKNMPIVGLVNAITGPDVTCQNTTSSYSIDSVPNATYYIWSFSGSDYRDSTANLNVSINFTTNYSSGNLIVTAKNTCATDTTSAPFYIKVNPSPVPNIVAFPTGNTVCKNARIHYAPVAAYKSYLWEVSGGIPYGSVTSREVTIDWNSEPAGSLGLVVENADGCSGSATYNVTKSEGTAPSPSTIWLFGYNLLVCSDSLAGYYRWFNEDGATLDTTYTNSYFIADTNYKKNYFVETCNGTCCNISDPISFSPKPPAAISDSEAGKINIFPNPAMDIIQIKLGQQYFHQSGRLILYNQYGTKVEETVVKGSNFQIDISGLPPGLYIARYISNEKGMLTSKIIKL